MSTASTASPAIVRSSSRRQSSYTAAVPDRPHRAPSTASKTTAAPNTPSRSDSQPQASTRPVSASQQAALASVARRDHETTNVARPPSSRQNSFREGSSYATQPPKRAESTLASRGTGARPVSHAREDSHGAAVLDAAPPVQTSTGPKQSEVATQGSVGTKKRTTIDAQTGKWALGKTIGQGSMGKVKLAKNVETGEQVGEHMYVTWVEGKDLLLSGRCEDRAQTIDGRAPEYKRPRARRCIEGSTDSSRSSHRHAPQPSLYLWDAGRH